MVRHRRTVPTRAGRHHRPNTTTLAADGTGAFLPDAITIAPRHLEVGDVWVASFAVTGYPRDVQPGWLQPLLTYPGRLDVALHIEPIDPITAARRLKRQLARLESGRRHTQERGRLPDLQIEAATEDAYDLSGRVARGEGKLFRLGLYLTVRATTDPAELAAQVAQTQPPDTSAYLDLGASADPSEEGLWPEGCSTQIEFGAV
ncbi:hypothetical protein ACH4OW_28835 [Streptomyces sp. NPDC017056]|uniref:hypothetical protein n=1 Tax=Streptomyces sp. NPDC017056 TaxID=3364973 RepID=UPI00379FC209